MYGFGCRHLKISTPLGRSLSVPKYFIYNLVVLLGRTICRVVYQHFGSNDQKYIQKLIEYFLNQNQCTNL